MTTTTETVSAGAKSRIMSGEEWLNTELRLDETEIVIGTPENAIVRPLTKNLIEAPDKSFKTTFAMRLALGISTGETVFSSLPVVQARRVLYLHGELSNPELKERLQEAAADLRRPLDNFFQGRSVRANLFDPEGQGEIRKLIEQFRPEVIVLDPWQSLIAGAEENNFKDVSECTRFMDSLVDDYAVTILLPIHQGKNAKKGARGHSSLAGWRDTRFTLKRTENRLMVTVDPRWGRAVQVNLVFKHGTLWEGNAPRWSKQADEIRKLLIANKGKLNRDEIGFGLGLKESTLRMALKRAQDDDAIRIQGDIVLLPGSDSQPASPTHPL